MRVKQNRFHEVAGAGLAHLAAILPATLLVKERQIEWRVQFGDVLRIEYLAALDLIFARDLQAVEVALAVTHDLVGAVAVFFRMGRLPVARMDVLGAQSDLPAEREVGLENSPRAAHWSAGGVHESG